jgi:hypothetical protein
LGRYFAERGYRDGARGLALAVMMAFYRALTYIKLWEKYQFEDEPIPARYEKIRKRLLTDWGTTNP